MGFPKFQWCKGHGLPQSGTGHYGCREKDNKHKLCKFFVVPGNGKALLGMPDIDMLNIIHRNCNTIDTQEADRANNCSTNTAICWGSRYEQH